MNWGIVATVTLSLCLITGIAYWGRQDLDDRYAFCRMFKMTYVVAHRTAYCVQPDGIMRHYDTLRTNR